MWYRFLVFNVVLLNIFRTFAAENNPNSREVVVHKYESDSTNQLISTYTPSLKTEQSCPTVIFLGGGGFQNMETEKTNKLVNILSDNGYNVFTLKYRTGWLKNSKTDFCAGNPEDLAGIILKELEDVYYMMEFLYENADEFNLNPENTFIIGGSAGAVIGLTYTYNAEYFVKWALENQCQLEDPELYISLLQSRKAPKAMIAIGGFLLEPDRVHSETIIPLFEISLTDDYLIKDSIGIFANCKSGTMMNTKTYGSQYIFEKAIEWNTPVDWLSVKASGHGMAGILTSESITQKILSFLEKHLSKESSQQELQWNKTSIKL